MKRILLLSLVFFISNPSFPQLTVLSSFDPANAGSLCGVGYQLGPVGTVYVYGCFETTIQSYTDAGAYITSVPVAGEPANDVDVFVAQEDLLVGAATVPEGTLLFVNGETDVAEIYAIDSAGAIIDTLVTDFGVSHVVGGAYHPIRNTFFLLQDNVPGANDQNMVAEIDPFTGDTIQTFQTTGEFDISYGDIDVSIVHGWLYIVSSNEDSIAEYTPTGTLMQKYALPAGVDNLSGIVADCALSTVWVSSNSGMVYNLGGFPCLTPGIGENPLVMHQSFYPNPFSQSASYEMKLMRNASVTMVLYDVSGRMLATVFEGELHAGMNTVEVKPHGLDHGLYIIRVSTEGGAFTHPVVYMPE